MSKTEDTEKTTKTTNRSGAKKRRKRRTNPDDVKMHLRLPRELHAECVRESERHGTSISAVILERLMASSTATAKSELSRLASEVSSYGEDVLRYALDAVWAPDETHRMRCIRDALHAACTATRNHPPV